VCLKVGKQASIRPPAKEKEEQQEKNKMVNLLRVILYMLRAMTMLVLMLCSKLIKKHKRRGRPRLTKVCQLINEVFNELLSDFEVTDGEDENIFYDSYEVRKENDGTAN
jgi:hypothetical protein